METPAPAGRPATSGPTWASDKVSRLRSSVGFALVLDPVVALGFGGQGGEECRLRVFRAERWSGDRGRVVVSTLSRLVWIFAVRLGPVDLRAGMRERMHA